MTNNKSYKKILFVSTRPPFPLLGGEKNKTFNIIKILSKKYVVIYCGLCPYDDFEEVNKLLRPYCEEIHLFNSNLLKGLTGSLKALLNGTPLQIGYFSSSDLKSFCEKKSKEVDGVFVNLFRAVQYVIDIDNVKYLDMSDSISEHYKNAVNVTTSPFWKFIYKVESKRMKTYEDTFLPIFKKVSVFNKEDIKLYKSNNIFWIPHGVNEEVLNFHRVNVEKKCKISFLGKMNYRPNIEAVKWFANKVLPFIDEKFSFQIIGGCPSREVIELSKNPRIEVLGFVDDPYLLLKQSYCVVAPMISGGGIQNKLLESMAIGTVNIVTTLCATPLINLKDEVIVCDDPLIMANIINDLDPISDKYIQLERSSRKYIMDNYTWDRYEESLFQEIQI